MQHQVTITSEYSGERLDKALAELFPDISRTLIAKLCDDNNIFVNGKPENKKYIFKENDEVILNIPPPKSCEAIPQDIDIPIVYMDDYIVVVNKPKGMVVHPANGNEDGTVVNALLSICEGELSGIGGVARPGIVHRIDKDTSGLIVIAKNDEAHIGLAEQFKVHSIDRVYHAIVHGKFKEKKGTVNAPIGRSTKDRKKMAVTEKNSKNAVTHYEVIEELGQYSYIKCVLETGRTHQIRVHMASIGHPLIGDTVYGMKKDNFNLNGQCLHAKVLGFTHPHTGEKMNFDSELPEYFTEILTKLRNKSYN